MSFSRQFLTEAAEIVSRLDEGAIERIVRLLADKRDGGGRLFILGVGGSAATRVTCTASLRYRICNKQSKWSAKKSSGINSLCFLCPFLQESLRYTLNRTGCTAKGLEFLRTRLNGHSGGLSEAGAAQVDIKTVATIIRMTGGNFRLLNRFLAQMERFSEINAFQEVTKAVVEAARESLVIGEA